MNIIKIESVLAAIHYFFFYLTHFALFWKYTNKKMPLPKSDVIIQKYWLDAFRMPKMQNLNYLFLWGSAWFGMFSSWLSAKTQDPVSSYLQCACGKCMIPCKRDSAIRQLGDSAIRRLGDSAIRWFGDSASLGWEVAFLGCEAQF